MKQLIKKLLREGLLGESAFTTADLPEGTGLFIKGGSLTLYNPEDEDDVDGKVYADITIEPTGFGNYYDVSLVAAEKGFGPLIYELAMMYIHTIGGKLMPSRGGSIRDGAMGIWLKMYNRKDVNKETFKIKDDEFIFDVLGQGNPWPEDKRRVFNELGLADQSILMAFNTTFSKEPSSEYKELIQVANSYPEDVRKIASEVGLKFARDTYEKTEIYN